MLKHRWCGVIVLGVASWCVTAAAQPRHDHRDDRDHRDVHDDRHHDARDVHPGAAPPPVAVAPPANVAVAPPADPALAGRIRTLEQQRRQARRVAMKDEKAWNAQREQRALAHRQQLTTTFGSVINTPEAKAELATHADRMARLDRILDLANAKGDTALAARVQNDINFEINRDTAAMQAIRAKAGLR